MDINSIKRTGIIRNLDHLGRLCIPRELLNLEQAESFEVIIDDEIQRVHLREYKRGCTFCGEYMDEIYYKESHNCTSCLKDLANHMHEEVGIK